MKRRFLVLLLVVSLAANSQLPVNNGAVLTTSSGNVQVTHYDRNIIKLTWQPRGYIRNELLSDAVKANETRQSQVHVEQKGDFLVIGNSLVVLPGDSAGGFYRFNFGLHAGEKIFGGGERALPLDRRGHRFNLYNNPWYGYAEGADNLNYSVPFFTSNRGYALFFDNPSRGFADIGNAQPNVFQVGFTSGELNVYCIFGSYEEILQSFHRLTGTQPLPPRWALGNLMSRFGYTSESQTKEILSAMQQQQVPVDAIIFDLFWFGDSIKGTMGNLDWVNRQKWPDPRKMIRDLKQQNIQTILVTEPFFVETARNYTASKKYLAVDADGKPYYLTDFYFGRGGLIDIFRKDARNWFWSFYKKQMDLGIEAWWGDLGEPEKHPADMYHNLGDLCHRRLFAADEVHNLFGHTWTRMLFEQYARHYPNKRLFSLNRSGFAGSQRFSIFPWTGDVSRSWSGLRAQLPILLGMSMSGIPYVHSDAGGFAGGEGDGELYVRWLQFAAFTPIFRPHGTALYEVEPAAFSFPSEPALMEEPYRTQAKAAVDLRYRLLPYNYSLAYQQTRNGKPLMSPMYFYFPMDTSVYRLQDQYMWGEDMLIAPVLEKGLSQRDVYLPAGKWLDNNNQVHEGDRWLTVPLNADHIPYFIKAGSFIPQLQFASIRNVADYPKTQAVLQYFPAREQTGFTWYEDDGHSKNAIESGNHTRIDCSGVERDHEIIIQLNASNARYLKDSLQILVSGLATAPRFVRVNNKRMTVVTQSAGFQKTAVAQATWSNGVLAIPVAWKKQPRLEVVVTK